jgi:hypothetical protein
MADVSPSSIAFNSLEEAVYRAAQHARSVYDNRNEAISLVYEHEGKFYYTLPRNSAAGQKGGHTQAVLSVPPNSARYIVHNHPQGQDMVSFSENDINMAEKMKIPSVIVYDGEEKNSMALRRYVPGQSKIFTKYDNKIRSSTKRSLGEPFEYVP